MPSRPLPPMLDQAQGILQSEDLVGLADSSYYEGNQLKACEGKASRFTSPFLMSQKPSPQRAVLRAGSSVMTPAKTVIFAHKETRWPPAAKRTQKTANGWCVAKARPPLAANARYADTVWAEKPRLGKSSAGNMKRSLSATNSGWDKHRAS